MTYEINTSQDESAVFFNKLDIIMEAIYKHSYVTHAYSMLKLFVRKSINKSIRHSVSLRKVWLFCKYKRVIKEINNQMKILMLLILSLKPRVKFQEMQYGTGVYYLK
jgi:hypothetical protein